MKELLEYDTKKTYGKVDVLSFDLTVNCTHSSRPPPPASKLQLCKDSRKLHRYAGKEE